MSNLTDIPTSAPKKAAKKRKKAAQGEVVSTQYVITSEQVQEVLDRIERGESERGACRAVGVSRSTFRTTVLKHQTADQYARALFGLAQDQIEKIETTIEDMRNGMIDSNMARVEIDTRKWFAAKFLPRQYGDKVDLTTNGKDLPSPILGVLAVPNATNGVISENSVPNHDSVQTDSE